MEARKLDNGTVISRARSPYGHGHVYYVDAGKEGKILLWDSYMIPSPTILAALAWETDADTYGAPKDPRLEFNKR